MACNGIAPGLSRAERVAIQAFSLLELLISMVVLGLLVVLASSLIGAIQNVWVQSSARTEQYRAARQALESIAARLSQATLNPYYDVAVDGSGVPVRYERQSELRFFCGPAVSTVGSSLGGARIPGGSAVFFQAPTGFFAANAASNLSAALNTWGYFVEYGRDSERPPFISDSIIPAQYRFRLVEFIDPSDSLTVFSQTSDNPNYNGREWFVNPLGVAANRRVLADNVVAFVALPRLSQSEDPTGTALSPNFLYDSTASNPNPLFNPRHQLPPIVDLAVVVIAENTANRIEWTSSPPDFGLSGLFQNAGNLESDLSTLRDNIEAQNLSARIFRTSVPISAARWSTEQEN